MKNYAPVVLFCYNRVNLLQKTIKALQANAEAKYTELFIYSDAGKDELSCKQVNVVRKYLRTITGFKSVTIVEQQENKKLEFNIVQGVTEVINRFGRVIILEDDIIVSEYFLKYMNQGLECYKDNPDVMEIDGFNPCRYPEDFPDTFCMRLTMGWGWGTWQDRWEKFRYFTSPQEALKLLSPEDHQAIELGGAFPCLRDLTISPIPWDICWYISLYLEKKVAVFPKKSLTKHIGFTGTHFKKDLLNDLFWNSIYDVKSVWKKKDIVLTNITERDTVAENIFKCYLENFKHDKLLLRVLKSVFRFVKSKILNKIKCLPHNK